MFLVYMWKLSSPSEASLYASRWETLHTTPAQEWRDTICVVRK